MLRIANNLSLYVNNALDTHVHTQCTPVVPSRLLLAILRSKDETLTGDDNCVGTSATA